MLGQKKPDIQAGGHFAHHSRARLKAAVQGCIQVFVYAFVLSLRQKLSSTRSAHESHPGCIRQEGLSLSCAKPFLGVLSRL